MGKGRFAADRFWARARAIGRAGLALALALGAAAVVPATAMAAARPGMAMGDAGAEVVAPLVLSHVPGASLAFGTLAAGHGGSLAVAADGSGASGIGVAMRPGSAVSADAFRVTGGANRAITIATSAGELRTASGVIRFVTLPSQPVVVLGEDGSAGFTVGGTLRVSGAEASGLYAGTYVAYVAYY